MKIIIKNKRAYFRYEVLERLRAGIELKGYEVKSIKSGRISLEGSFVVIGEEEAFLIGANIPAYQPKNTPADYNPTRPRKLLLKRAEIKYLIGKARQKGLTMVPLMVYSERGKIKVEFGLVKIKKKIDKREEIKKKETEREIRRLLKEGDVRL